MSPTILGLHHVTATVAGAQEDLDFYVGLLGLRLVKKTVNFDNPGVYHFYYGDEQGTPGTLMTTFPYRDRGVPRGAHGAGQITVTSFSVPRGALAAWRERFAAAGLEVREPGERFGAGVLEVTDPSGLRIEVIEADDARSGWADSGVAPETLVRGVHGVTLTLRERGPSLELLLGELGGQVVGEEGARTRVAVGGDRPGHYLELLEERTAPAAVNGVGTVHHVAMAVAGDEEQQAAREALLARGRAVTEVRDRQYFRSIYFREPGGVLYEIATLPPGFLIDESPAELGEGLKLPPWEEPRRARIEAVLPEVRLPRAGSVVR